MPIRQFRDSSGARWEVWETTPDSLHPVTRAEDYMHALGGGWLTFDRADRGDKRRLHPIPVGWEDAPDAELDLLRQRAERVRSDSGQWRKYSERTADSAAPPRATRAADQGAGQCSSVRRSFLYPGGRLWTVCEMLLPRADGEGEGMQVLLRFLAGARELDLATWPADWSTFTDAQLVDLLRRAFPREAQGQNVSGSFRRFDDIRP
ncbi:MAG: hypothetical protein NVS9B3_05370 [Gemmatimonadaceae bacterium]